MLEKGHVPRRASVAGPAESLFCGVIPGRELADSVVVFSAEGVKQGSFKCRDEQQVRLVGRPKQISVT